MERGWFTRFNISAFRFGNLSLFVKKDLFKNTGGFCEELIVMEDQHLIIRLRKYNKSTILQGAVLTSAREYIANGNYKTQSVFSWSFPCINWVALNIYW
ncbi:MAG: hypothetical protein ABI416_10170 [Ginsengibacter sp.]